MTMDVGYTIKKARMEKGLTQEALADMVGVKKSAVAKWETGRVSEIKRSNLKKLAEALDLKPTQLLGDIEDDPIGAASELADYYLDVELREMVKAYKSLDSAKRAQVREYIQFLSDR